MNVISKCTWTGIREPCHAKDAKAFLRFTSFSSLPYHPWQDRDMPKSTRKRNQLVDHYSMFLLRLASGDLTVQYLLRVSLFVNWDGKTRRRNQGWTTTSSSTRENRAVPRIILFRSNSADRGFFRGLSASFPPASLRPPSSVRDLFKDDDEDDVERDGELTSSSASEASGCSPCSVFNNRALNACNRLSWSACCFLAANAACSSACLRSSRSTRARLSSFQT